MRSFIILLSALLFFVNISLAGKGGDNNCMIMHEGTFKYKGHSPDAVITIKGNKHKETYKNGKEVIESKLEWVSDCEYKMTITKVNIPNFPFKKGDTMDIKILKIDGDTIDYAWSINGDGGTDTMVKVK